MGIKMKFRQKLKFTTTAFLMMFGVHSHSQAQTRAQSSMTVSVRVVSAPQFSNNIVTDITDQLQEQNQHFSLGEFSVKFPKGGNYSISFDPLVKMNSSGTDTDSWDINTSFQQETDNQGKLTLRLTGDTTTTSVRPGQYSGQLTTTIEYH
jgi:hypothetical protein